jgi:signal transduction histidine kinase
LDLAQLESGKYQLAEEEISINRILKYECKKFDVIMLKKGINFKLDIERESIIVKADSFRIEQVLSNLMQNAFRYTPDHGYIVIKVTEEEDYVLISIENSCPQIPEEELHRIWDHFYRIDKSRNIYMGGTGLGLSIVKNILELHDSRYGVERTQNGVRFYFTLQKYNDIANEI